MLILLLILQTGDSVLARVSRYGQETWVPGIIQFGPADELRARAKFYTVVLYNYKKVRTVHLILWSKFLMFVQSYSSVT